MKAEQTEEHEEERRCEGCGGPYDQPPADSHIPVCVDCLRAQSWPPTEHPARLTR